MSRTFVVTLVVLGTTGPAAFSQSTPADQALQGFLDVFKPSLIEAVPHPLFEKSYDWGRQSPTFHGIRWNGLKPRVVKTPKNDGTWRKVRIDTRNWPHSLVLKVHEVKQADPERITFKLFLSCQGQAEVEQQNWENGVRLYSGSLRARFQVIASLDCECTMKLDTSKGVLPDFVFRLRVTKSQVMIHDPVVEHIAGFGGTAARLAGEAIHDVVHLVRPSLEERMLENVNKAIVRAADTREVRLSFSKMLEKKK